MATQVTDRRDQPESNRAWSIETNGINPIPESERQGKPFDLFWIWFAANVSILGLTYGAFLVTFYGLNLWQGLLAAVIGTVASFVLVGFISLAGKLGSAPTLILSRAAFGVRGNALPTLVSYVSLVGWETILVALASLAAEAVLDRLGVAAGKPTLAVSFVIIAGVTILIGLLGQATILKIATWFTWAFGVMTVVFFGLELDKIDWHKVATLPTGTFWGGFVGGMSVLMAGLGIGWVNAAADYSRYVPRSSRSGAVVWWTVFGASVAPVVLIAFGILLAANHPGLASAANPIGDLAKPLPTWFLVPYLITAVGGLIAGALLDIYSSGLNLLTLGVRLPRYQSVAIDGTLMLGGNIYLLFFGQDFIGKFITFLVTLGVPLAAWAAIFLMDLLLYRRRDGYDEVDLYRPTGRYGAINAGGVSALVAATFIGIGLVTSTTPGFTWEGYILRWFGWDKGPLNGSSIGLFIAFGVAALIYAVLGRQRAPRAGSAPASSPAPASA